MHIKITQPRKNPKQITKWLLTNNKLTYRAKTKKHHTTISIIKIINKAWLDTTIEHKTKTIKLINICLFYKQVKNATKINLIIKKIVG